MDWTDPGCTPVDCGVYSGNATPDLSYKYTGGFLPNCKWTQFGAGYSNANFALECANPGSKFPTGTNASSYGATGWKRFRPGTPGADLATFIGELKDVPRMLRDTAAFFHKKWKELGGGKTHDILANQWLSTQFGWLPFISDLRKFYIQFRKLESEINRIRANNGRWVRRGGSVLDRTETTVLSSNSSYSGHWPTLVSYLYLTPQGSSVTRLTVSERVWFEGCFRYYIPNIDTPLWNARAVASLFGALPNPGVIWELTPFSWLVDWIVDLGDVFANMDTNNLADNLVAKYAYVMKSVDITGEFESTCNFKSTKLHRCWTFPVSFKSRAGASRFGFGLTDDEFTARQWSILTALGIQRRTKPR